MTDADLAAPGASEPARLAQPSRRAVAMAMALGLVVGASAVLALGWLQSARHGWPFAVSIARGALPTGSLSDQPRDHEPASEEPARVPVEIPRERLTALGVSFEAARVEQLGAETRAVATVVPDEARISDGCGSLPASGFVGVSIT